MYAFTFEAPANQALYEEIRSGISELHPKGRVVHLVVKTESGLRHTDVWESQADWERFNEEQVMPSVVRALTAAGIDPSLVPPSQDLEVVDVVVGA
ncbi:MAG: hypothetical protein QOH36_1024 [Actinomycetota bacterium]|nr:hypothetical protein [Actinomycetota bacterium]